jgi:ADP-ribosylation factor-like protein 5B
MGILLAKLWRRVVNEVQGKIVIVGLNNAGKTTILYRLNLGTVVTTQPTIGSNVEEVKHGDLVFQVWDVGGQESLRATWESYLQSTDAIVFVVDSNDEENMTLAKMELFNVLLGEHARDCVVLVLANKQDIKGALPQDEVAEKLDLVTLRTHEWRLQGCCALSGEGLVEGMDWIAAKVLDRRSAIGT